MATLSTSYQLIKQGAQKQFGGAYGRLDLYAKYNSQSVENNTTSVTWKLALVVWNGYIGDYNNNKPVNITGTTGSQTTYIGSKNYYSQDLAEYTETITHNGDGTKTATASGSVNFTAWGQSLEVSGASCSLPTIPRASEISSVSTVNIGSVATILVNRKSSSFTHTITYSFGNLSGTITNKSADTTLYWTIPTTFYEQIPRSKTGSGTLTITTYSGSTQIGGSNTKTFYVNTSESACRPTITRTAEDSNQTTLGLTGNKYRFVRGYSNVLVNCSATARNSAKMSSLTVSGSSVGSPGSTTQSGSRTLNGFSDTSISIIATDSRGYSTTNSLTDGTDFVLVNYIPLTFSGEITRRNPTSDIFDISFSGKYFNGNFGSVDNSLTISWKWRRKGDTTWSGGSTFRQGTDYTVNTSANTYSSGSGSYQSAIQLATGFNYKTNYEIGIFYNDELVSNIAVLDGKKGVPIVNWNNAMFNINGDLYIEGTKAIWYE